MALKNFGVKEVADVRFYPANALKYDRDNETLAWNTTDTTKMNPILEFTTLKVSNLEITAETTDARGGKGNSKLITWDHSRTATLTLEDALLSLDTIQALMGAGDKSDDGDDDDNRSVVITSDSFADAYCIVGTTFAKSQDDGTDHLFTFFVPNAKVGTDLNLTMEAEGDPTVFSMTLDVLRASKTDSTMIALIANNKTYTEPTTTGATIFDTVIPEKPKAT